MDTIKKLMGFVWMALGPIAIYFMGSNALLKISAAAAKIDSATDDVARGLAEAAKTNITLQWGIIITVFLPIAVGMIIFGYYAFKGEYNTEEAA